MTAPVRQPLLEEMFDAYRAAIACSPDSVEHHYLRGVGMGYGIGFGLLADDLLLEARMIHGALPVDYDEAIGHWTMRLTLAETTLAVRRTLESAHACGVLWGFKQATSERDDADECLMCQGRILTETHDYQRCDHGLCCVGDCFDMWHADYRAPYTCLGF